jgi:DNA ligase-associated metallophosphoesterase
VTRSIAGSQAAFQAAALAGAGFAPAAHGAGEITVAGVSLVADLAGALFWPEEGLLVVSDLHLEKGSAFAVRGVLMPPYDTATTLERLAGLLARYAARIVVALGDNFHDGGGPARLAVADRTHLFELQRGRDWVWIAGNHDPDPREGIGGAFARSLALGPLTFRHEPMVARARGGKDGGNGGDCSGEIAGHLHPAARILQRGRTQTRKCFATDGTRLVMPAFGAYTGGLNIRNIAFLKVFGALGFTAHLIGQRRLYSFAAARCLAD